MTGKWWAAALLALSLSTGGCAWEKAEGRPWVHTLKIDGMKQVKRRDLLMRIGISESSWNPLVQKTFLNPLAVAEDESRIVAFYHARGYYGASVDDARVIPRKNPKSVDVHFAITEGLPTRIFTVIVTGVDDLDAEARKLVLHLNIVAGQPFDSDKYLQEKEIITANLKNSGYPWAQVQARVEVNRDERQAAITYTVDHGPKAVFDGVDVIGTTTVDASRVVVQTGIQKNDPFRLDLIDPARDEVYRLGVFSSVRLTYQPVADQPGRVRLIVKVKESTFNEIRLGFGFGIDSRRNEVHVEAIYVRHNFLGGMRTLQLRIAPAYVVVPVIWAVTRHGPALTAESVLTQPRVGFLTQIQWVAGYDVGVDYAYQFEGPRTSLSLLRTLWRQRVNLSLSYNFQFLTFFNTDPAIFLDPAQAGRFFGFVDPYRVAWLQQDVSLDLRDSPLDSRKGAYLLATAGEGGVYTGSAFLYEKIQGEVRGYIPLGDRVVLASRIMAGHIFSQGDLGSPITRRFYLGGPNSHRGFTYNRLSLQVPSGIGGTPPIPVGGDEMFLAQAEVRIKAVKLRGNWLSFAAFYDGGDVSAPSCGTAQCALLPAQASTHVDLRRLHHAVGGGVRFQTVIGTLRADLGVRLNRLSPTEPDGLPNPDPNSRLTFHLSVSEAF